MPVNHHTGCADAADGPRPGGRGRVPARGLVVVAPRALPPHRAAACSSATPTCSSCSPSRAPRGCPTSCNASTTSSTACAAPVGLAGARVGRAGRGEAVAAAERVLGPPVPRRCELHPPGRGRRCATRSASTGSCGGATTRTRRPATRTRARPSALAFAGVPRDEVAADARRQRRRLYGFDLDALCAPRRSGSARVADVADPLGRASAADADSARLQATSAHAYRPARHDRARRATVRRRAHDQPQHADSTQTSPTTTRT